jgi:signal transduction histidine kinase
VPLVWRRRWPFWSGIAVGVITMVLDNFETPYLSFAAIVAVYTVATYGTAVERRIAIVFVVLAVGYGTFAGADFGSLAEDALVYGTAWVLGALQRTRRAYMAELEARAERLEQEREDRARLAVAEERSRIARELHDVVAHSVSLMVVQTLAARSTLRRDPAAADEALEQVETVGRDSLKEMRRLLGVLRRDEQASMSPQPGLGDLDELVGQLGDLGLLVARKTHGEPKPLSPLVDLAAYRIAQEALTNVLRHAQASRAEISTEWSDGTLTLRVVDDGSGKAPPEAGFGIVGMRERAQLVGGKLTAGPSRGGGFEVVAQLPLREHL